MARVCSSCGFCAMNKKQRQNHCCCRVVDDELAQQQYDELTHARIDPWGRKWYLDVMDNGDEWAIVDGNGMIYKEPKPMMRIPCRLRHRRDHFAK